MKQRFGKVGLLFASLRLLSSWKCVLLFIEYMEIRTAIRLLAGLLLKEELTGNPACRICFEVTLLSYRLLPVKSNISYVVKWSGRNIRAFQVYWFELNCIIATSGWQDCREIGQRLKWWGEGGYREETSGNAGCGYHPCTWLEPNPVIFSCWWFPIVDQEHVLISPSSFSSRLFLLFHGKPDCYHQLDLTDIHHPAPHPVMEHPSASMN